MSIPGSRCGKVAALFAALVIAGIGAADADGLQQLRSFHATTKSGSVAFRQVVAAKGQDVARESAGTFSFERPGKFRWAYDAPYEQLIVGDGERLWVYDRDLNQVIVRKLDRALGSTPAALLAGGRELEHDFELADAGRGAGVEYVDVKPRSTDSGFDQVRIGFAGNLPRTMRLTDAFGNVTTLHFGAFERNPRLDESRFRFVPPKGADVVGDGR